jgi:hypothetical protein
VYHICLNIYFVHEIMNVFKAATNILTELSILLCVFWPNTSTVLSINNIFLEIYIINRIALYDMQWLPLQLMIKWRKNTATEK